jgi:hypothetical protein
MYGQGAGYGQQGAYGQNPYATSGTGANSAYQDYQEVKQKKPVGGWIILGVVAVALIVVIALVVRSFIGNGDDDDYTAPPPVNGSEVSICPKGALVNERSDHPNDGRVHGGKLSYPKLGSPWEPVIVTDYRIPFGRDVAEQTVTIHSDYGKLGESWVAAVMIGELYAGDGFYAPEEASQIVNKCIFGAFYGDAKVVGEVLRSEAYPLGGHDGWITVTNLSFSIPNLPTTSELVTVIIVQTSQMSSSIFYSSIPGDASQLDADVDYAIANLQVDP